MREAQVGLPRRGGGDISASSHRWSTCPSRWTTLTQDFGVRAAYNFETGNVHASFNRNLYNNRGRNAPRRQPVPAGRRGLHGDPGPGRRRRRAAPLDQRSRQRGQHARGGLPAEVCRPDPPRRRRGDGAWTQNAPFYPYTINSTDPDAARGARADSLSSLQQPSFNGKINTTTLNFTFTSRPIKGLGLRARYRSYELANKTSRFVITGDSSGSPDRSWAS